MPYKDPEKRKAALKAWRKRTAYRSPVNDGRYRNMVRHLLMERDGGVCGICGGTVTFEEASPDHIVQLQHGGSDEATNIRLAHLKCNMSRSRKP